MRSPAFLPLPLLLCVAAWHCQEAEEAACLSLAVPAADRTNPNGWWGMLLFVATEATLFGADLRELLLHSLPARAVAAARLPRAGAAVPACPWRSSSRDQRTRSRSPGEPPRAGRVRRAWWLLALPARHPARLLRPCSAVFDDDLQKLGRGRGRAYGLLYYLMLGAHHFHVAPSGSCSRQFLLFRLARRGWRATG